MLREQEVEGAYRPYISSRVVTATTLFSAFAQRVQRTLE
jgi:hypothetical protein